MTGSDKFNFIRIGIDDRTEEQRKFMSGADYVLSRFSSEEVKILHSTFDTITKNLE
jgi:peptidyl-tRNA hydrolase